MIIDFQEFTIFLDTVLKDAISMIELFISLQLIQILTPGSNLINFYEDQKKVGCVRLFHINKV